MPEFKLEQGQLLHVLIPDKKTKPAQLKFSMAVVVAAYDQFFVVTLRSVEGWMSFFYDQIVEEHSESPERMEVLILKIDGEPVFSGKKDGEYTYMPEPKNMKVETAFQTPHDITNGEVSDKITEFIKSVNKTDTLSVKIPEDLFISDKDGRYTPAIFHNVVTKTHDGYLKRLFKALFNIK